MAIDTYTKLQSEILDTLNRTDLAAEVAEYAPGPIEGAVTRAISKAERRIVRRLRSRAFETSTTVATAAGVETVALPTDYVMMKMLMIPANTGSGPAGVLVQKDLTTLINDRPGAGAGIPSAYAAFGASLYLRPVPDAARSLRMFYYAAPAPLSGENTSNALLAQYPDLLLYGALIELTAHLEDDGRIGLWKAAFDEALGDIIGDDVLNRWSGAPIRASVDARGIV